MHDNIVKVVRWKLCEKYHLEKKDKWYEHVAYCEHPMWSCHHCYNRHDHVVVNKKGERECAIVDTAVAGDKGIVEKVKKHQELKGTLQGCGTRELCR